MAAMKSVFLAAVLAVALVAAAAGTRVALEADVPVHLPADVWMNEGPAAPTEPMQLTFALKQRNVDALEATLYAVSDPASPNYGQHLSRDEISERIAPSVADVYTVLRFVRSHMAADASHDDAWWQLSVSGDFLHVTVPVSVAMEMLDVPAIHRYTHRQDGSSYLRSPTHYSVPAEIAQLVDLVLGVNRLPRTTFSRNTPDYLATAAAAAATAGTGSSSKAGLRGTAVDETTAVPPAGNVPVTLSFFGGADGMAFVWPRCSDGGAMYAVGQCTHAGSEAPTALTTTVTPLDTRLAASTATLDSSSFATMCMSCTEWATNVEFGFFAAGTCAANGRTYGLHSPDSVIYCGVNMHGATLAANSTVATVASYAGAAASGSQSIVSDVQPLVTPAYIRSLYNVPADLTGTNPGNSQSVAEFLKQYYLPSDLASYMKHFDIPEAKANVVGYNDPDMAGGEASLDIEVIMGVATGIKTYFTSTSGLRNNSEPTGHSNQEPFLRWIMTIGDQADPALTHSSSYSDAEHYMPEAFTNRLNVEFMKAGARGLSLLFATGDDGAPGGYLRDTTCKGFFATFPPTSPFVTSVGGTQITRQGPNNEMREATSDTATGAIITSGGGFSRRYARPQYQKDAVGDYLARPELLPPASWFNATGRAYPDISAIATNFLVYINSTQWIIGGTSASTPTVTSLISLLNDHRLNNNMAPLGFLNPMLYAMYGTEQDHVFNDIVEGINACSAIPTHCCPYGFKAGPGWDATTGIGSPIFDALADAVIPRSDPVKVTYSTGSAFDIHSVEADSIGAAMGPGVDVGVTIKGVSNKRITAGTVKYQVWENEVQHFVAQGNSPYFQCTIKSCNPAEPIALHLSDPTAARSDFTLSFSFPVPESQASGQFRVVTWGEDQDHTPYDFDATIMFNSTISL